MKRILLSLMLLIPGSVSCGPITGAIAFLIAAKVQHARNRSCFVVPSTRVALPGGLPIPTPTLPLAVAGTGAALSVGALFASVLFLP